MKDYWREILVTVLLYAGEDGISMSTASDIVGASWKTIDTNLKSLDMLYTDGNRVYITEHTLAKWHEGDDINFSVSNLTPNIRGRSSKKQKRLLRFSQ